MTKFEKIIFALLASLFGEKPARKIMCVGVDIITVLAFAGYLCTLPFRFVLFFQKPEAGFNKRGKRQIM